MKHIERIIIAILLVVLVCPASLVYAKTVKLSGTASNTLLMKRGATLFCYEKARNTWKSINGKKYYFKSNGKAAKGLCQIEGKYYIFDSNGKMESPKKPKLFTVGNSKYIIGSNGRAVSGWHVFNGKLYYSLESGKCVKNKVVDKIQLTAKSYAKTSDVRTKLMIKAFKKIDEITNDKMTQMEKLKACWNYAYSKRIQIDMYPNFNKEGWQIGFAYSMFDSKVANCWGIACTFCSLAKALGEDPYLVGTNVDLHGWTMINGKHWDTLENRMNADSGYFPLDENTIARFW